LERRIVSSLIIMVGLTMLAIGLHFNQMSLVLDTVKTVWEPILAGLP